MISQESRPLKHLRRFVFPAFVKPVSEESSDGIAKASFAKSEEEALERARFIHEKFHCDALIEEYIEGRELYLSVMGNRKLTVFPPREIFFRCSSGRRSRNSPPSKPSGTMPIEKVGHPERARRRASRRLGRKAHPPGAQSVSRAENPRASAASTCADSEPAKSSLSKPIPIPRWRAKTTSRNPPPPAGLDYEALIQKILDTAVRLGWERSHAPERTLTESGDYWSSTLRRRS